MAYIKMKHLNFKLVLSCLDEINAQLPSYTSASERFLLLFQHSMSSIAFKTENILLQIELINRLWLNSQCFISKLMLTGADKFVSVWQAGCID
jgi:hypothetical protein